MPEDLLGLMDHWGPERIICVSDRRTGMRGVLVIDNTARGMGKGGTRMSPTLTVTEVARLARTMTLKWAAADLFLGGAKAGILGNPNAANKEQLLRAFVRALTNEIPRSYVLGLDMGLTERDAAIFQDELGDRGASVGSPSELGGVPYDKLGITGFGVAEAAEAAMQADGKSLRGARVSVQGLGAVGSSAISRLNELGATIVAASTAQGAVHDPDGLDVETLLRMHHQMGDTAVNEYPRKTLDPGTELLVDCDVLVPAACEDTIDRKVASEVTAHLVVEAANMPTLPSGREVFGNRDILVIPDFIANAGGVIAGAYEMDRLRSPFRPDPSNIFNTVSTKIRANVQTIVERARAQTTTPYDVARTIAQDRVRAAMELKGYPFPK